MEEVALNRQAIPRRKVPIRPEPGMRGVPSIGSLLAARGERMSHVLPPRPSGALAALRGNRGADVIFASHTGLGLATYPRELWRDMPIGRTLHTRMWLVPAAERPTEADDQVAWLFEWWKRIDDWIEGHGSES